MDSQQFCAILREARQLTGINIIDLCYKLRKTEATVRDFLRGRADNTMPKVFAYLNAINCELLIQNGDNTIVLNSNDVLHSWTFEILKTKSQRQFAEIFDVAPTTIGNILKGGVIRQSLFLKLVDYTGSKVYIHPIDSISIDDVSDCDIEI